MAISFAYFLLRLISEYKENKLKVSNIIILLYIVFGAGGYVINNVKSEAYLPMPFPLLFLIIAIFIAEVIKKNKTIGLVLLGVIIFTNLVSLSENIRSPHSLTQRIQIVDKIVHKVGTKPFQLRGEGEGSQFRSFTMNYEYLLWWRGIEPVENAESVVTIVEEKENIRYEIESIN